MSSSLIEILRNILISKEAIIIPIISKKKNKYSNIKVLFKYKDINIELNLDNLFEIKYLSNVYILNEEQVRLVGYLLKFKISHKIIKMFFSINCDFYKINLNNSVFIYLCIKTSDNFFFTCFFTRNISR